MSYSNPLHHGNVLHPLFQQILAPFAPPTIGTDSMTTQPEALRLADAIERAIRPEASVPLTDWARAAAELRRLHLVEQRAQKLLEALDAKFPMPIRRDNVAAEMFNLRAAIKAAEENT